MAWLNRAIKKHGSYKITAPCFLSEEGLTSDYVRRHRIRREPDGLLWV
jgi:hypothetical protein